MEDKDPTHLMASIQAFSPARPVATQDQTAAANKHSGPVAMSPGPASLCASLGLASLPPYLLGSCYPPWNSFLCIPSVGKKSRAREAQARGVRAALSLEVSTRISTQSHSHPPPVSPAPNGMPAALRREGVKCSVTKELPH